MRSLDPGVKYIFIGPHLDDIAFSCGGLICKAVSLGCNVEVVTIYTKQVDPETLPNPQRTSVSHDHRKQEDIAGMGILGAVPIWAEFTERYLRPPWLANPLQIFRCLDQDTLADFSNMASLRKYLGALFLDNDQAQFYVNLGVGNHHDHVELFLAATTTAFDLRVADRLNFYEDAYALGTRMRRRHYITRRASWRWWQAPASRSIKWFIVSAVMASQARGMPMEDYLPESCRGLEWSLATVGINGFVDQKLEAMSKYESQVDLFGGMKMFDPVYRRYHQFWGEAEPYWSPAT